MFVKSTHQTCVEYCSTVQNVNKESFSQSRETADSENTPLTESSSLSKAIVVETMEHKVSCALFLLICNAISLHSSINIRKQLDLPRGLRSRWIQRNRNNKIS